MAQAANLASSIAVRVKKRLLLSSATLSSAQPFAVIAQGLGQLNGADQSANGQTQAVVSPVPAVPALNQNGNGRQALPPAQK